MPSKPDLRVYLGKRVHVQVDRPLGSVHPRSPDFIYPVNYGFVPGTISGDGMPIDAYLLGPGEPLLQAEGIVIAVVVREDDDEDKLVVATDEGSVNALAAENIMAAIYFQEQYFRSRIVMRREIRTKPGAKMDGTSDTFETTQPIPGVAVRKATARDADLLIRLIIGLAEFERLPPPDEAAQERLVQDAFGPRPRFDVFLAEVRNDVAGYAFVFETYSTFLALPTLYLEDLFVMPEYRKQRVGYAMMLYLADEALRRGCGRLDWVVLDWNHHAIDFYERLGARRLADWLPYRLDRAELQRMVGSQAPGTGG